LFSSPTDAQAGRATRRPRPWSPSSAIRTPLPPASPSSPLPVCRARLPPPIALCHAPPLKSRCRCLHGACTPGATPRQRSRA
jgi:hypothetical protein